MFMQVGPLQARVCALDVSLRSGTLARPHPRPSRIPFLGTHALHARLSSSSFHTATLLFHGVTSTGPLAALLARVFVAIAIFLVGASVTNHGVRRGSLRGSSTERRHPSRCSRR